jgi:hypothetical protein
MKVTRLRFEGFFLSYSDFFLLSRLELADLVELLGVVMWSLSRGSSAAEGLGRVRKRSI